jgi:Rrf2 family protein
MRISTKGSYALEAMLAIALHADKRSLSIREISDMTDISDKYLEQIFLLLKNDRLIIGTRGIGGGYVLSRAAGEITVGQILRATENSFSPVACIDNDKLCERSGNCVTRDIWNRLNNAISDRVDHMTLDDLRSRYLTTGDRAAEQYNI